MAFWQLLAIVGLLGLGLLAVLSYLVRQALRTHRAQVDASKARLGEAFAKVVRRLGQRRKQSAGRMKASSSATVQRGVAANRTSEAQSPGEEIAPSALRGFGHARPIRPGKIQETEVTTPAPAPDAVVEPSPDGIAGSSLDEPAPAPSLPGLEGVREASEASPGQLSALFDRLENGDMTIEEFLKAVGFERDESERQMRLLEMTHADRAALEQDSAYQRARDACLAAIKCQEWALGFRETMRHSPA